MKYVFGKTLVTFSLIFSTIVPKVQSLPQYTTIPYEEHVDYRAKMYHCALVGGEMALAHGYICEMMRNAKLIALGRADELTSYFKPQKSNFDILNEMIADDMKTEYEVAGEVYEHLAKNGYSDVAIAAILGNMMNETGGDTLELKPFIFDDTKLHYGLCQWNIRYHPDVNGKNVKEQLLYLTSTIEKTMKQFGGSFEEFNSLEGAEYAGTYFCKYYERGINTKQRGLNAIVAYEWIRRFK